MCIRDSVHSSCATGDIFGSMRCDCGEQLHRALQMIEKEGKGAVVYLNQEGRGIGPVSYTHLLPAVKQYIPFSPTDANGIYLS